MRTAAVFAILLVVAGSGLAAATDVYWIPAHHLAPQGHSARFASADLDGDADVDISMLFLNPARQYWNVGTPQNPEWELDLTQFGDVPYCSYRSGAFGDVDDDGDLDLLIACYVGYPPEPPRFYWNVGTPQDPSWSPDPSVVQGVIVPEGAAEPYFADLDADGDLDIAIAVSSGYVKHYENVGTATEPTWEYLGQVGGVMIAGAFQTLSLGDVDLDGDLDLVAITEDTPVQCWENVGTPLAYEFLENPAMLSGVDGPPFGKGIDLLDIDADGDPDLLIAAGFGQNLLYLNEGFTPVERTSWGTVKALFR